ncbi:MAG: cupin domain-containing protein [Alphaproteobacteria bacterium]|nr:cupin domain-containing protein [Alphaproteobacteria bacterium]
MEEDSAKDNDTADLEEDETDTYIRPGEAGHNKPKEVVWVRWQKKRTFVRALEGTYGEVYKSLYEQPRVYRSPEMKWKGGPWLWGKKVINPQSAQVAQSIEVHLSVYSPGTEGGQKHGHMNSAVFVIIKGKGYDVHDGQLLTYEAGDAMICENACVHQHNNAQDDEEMLVLVIKAKPLFLFMHMIFQKNVDMPPNEIIKGYEDYQPPENF